MKNKLKMYVQKFAFWLLKKTNYCFKVEHKKFEIEVQKVGFADNVTRYDFVLNGKKNEFLYTVYMVRYFDAKDIFNCPNGLTKGVKFNDEKNVQQLEKSFNSVIDKVVNSAMVKMP